MENSGNPRMREPRRPVRIGARLKSGRGWSDMVIRNVSSRGMMGVSDSPPARGDYVEVRCGTYVFVARVAWTEDGAFGAQSQFRIELDDLLAGSEGRAPPPGERRKLPRLLPAPALAPAERAERSARLGRMFDFVTLAVACAVFAGFVGDTAYSALAAPMTRAAHALETSSRSESVR